MRSAVRQKKLILLIEGIILFIFLRDRQLFINEESYDWYLVGKNPDQDMFKVVGLHKEDSSKNLEYLLGKDGGTDAPYLIELPQGYLDSDWAECTSYANRNCKKLGGLT